MKTIMLARLVVGFLTCALATPMWAEIGEKNMSLSVEPMSLLSGAIPVTLSIGLGSKFSLGITGYDKFFSLTKIPIQGVGGGLSGKFHLSADAFTNGWFVKPEVMAGYWQIGEGESKTRGVGVEPRLVAGYDWIWPAGFVLSLGIGIKYVYFSGNKEMVKDVSGFGFHEFFPNADLGLGWAF